MTEKKTIRLKIKHALHSATCGARKMIEELEAYAKESKVDDLFRDMMTGCFKKRPSAPVTYILEYLASEYPEESLTHARAFVDLKDGITSANVAVDEDEDGAHDVVVEDIDEKHEIVEAPLTSPKDVPAKATDVAAEAIEDVAVEGEILPDEAQHLMAPEEGAHVDVVVDKPDERVEECESVAEEPVDADAGEEEQKEPPVVTPASEEAVESITNAENVEDAPN